jgi:hypothetical protein
VNVGNNNFNGDAISSFCGSKTLSEGYLDVTNLHNICIPRCFDGTNIITGRSAFAQNCNVSTVSPSHATSQSRTDSVSSANEVAIIVIIILCITVILGCSVRYFYNLKERKNLRDSAGEELGVDMQIFNNISGSIKSFLRLPNAVDELFDNCDNRNSTANRQPVMKREGNSNETNESQMSLLRLNDEN